MTLPDDHSQMTGIGTGIRVLPCGAELQPAPVLTPPTRQPRRKRAASGSVRRAGAPESISSGLSKPAPEPEKPDATRFHRWYRTLVKWLLGYVSLHRWQATSRRLQTCEWLSLGDQRFVAIVRVDDAQYLLGGSSESVSLLAELQPAKEFPSLLLKRECQRAAEDR